MSNLFSFQRKGTSPDVITIHTGEDDIKNLSIIDQFNGQHSLNMWSSDECNQIDGTDGSQFPPHYMDKVQKLNVFIKSFCRKFPLIFDSEVNIFDGIPAWRYKAPLDVFAHPNITAENQCYCDVNTGVCPPSGVLDVQKCFNAPIIASMPHFLGGDAKLFKNIIGLNPKEELHRNYADIHPRLAFPISGASRFQINVQIKKDTLFTGIC